MSEAMDKMSDDEEDGTGAWTWAPIDESLDMPEPLNLPALGSRILVLGTDKAVRIPGIGEIRLRLLPGRDRCRHKKPADDSTTE
jgi:hypothetical protein